jgi:hypothetical protein
VQGHLRTTKARPAIPMIYAHQVSSRTLGYT